MEPISKEDIALIEFELAEQERILTNIKGKHIKSVLSKLERLNMLTPQIRKIVLDGFNDFTRENLRYLGFDVPD